MLHSREVAHITTDASSIESEVINQCCDMFDMHIAIVDTIAWMAMFVLFDYKVDILQKHILDLKRKVALLLILLGQMLHNLLDIHLAIGRFTDIEICIAN